MCALGYSAGDFRTTHNQQTVRARSASGTRRRRLARAVAATAAAIETLECRRMLSVAINGSVTLDESPGLQAPPAVAVPGEDNNDNDVALSVLQSQAPTFYNRLFGSPTIGLG